ncbi:MAG: hypothetical protein U0228_24575 [Myxococcaceae bacterium]
MRRLVLAALVLTVPIAWGLWSLDGPLGVLCLTSRTVYAPGYRDALFRSIRLGMTEAEVRQVLGTPHHTLGGMTADDPTFGYSWREGDDGCYRQRSIGFERGAVTSVLAGCNCD